MFIKNYCCQKVLADSNNKKPKFRRSIACKRVKVQLNLTISTISGKLFSILNTQKRKPSGSMPADAPPHMASARSVKPRNYLRKHVFKAHLRRKSTNYLRKHA